MTVWRCANKVVVPIHETRPNGAELPADWSPGDRPAAGLARRSGCPDRQFLHITFLDVGSADAVLIKTPTGKHVLINGGPSVTTLADELGGACPPSTANWTG